MYRSSKMKVARRAGGNLLVVIATLTSGVAITYAMAHGSHAASVAAVGGASPSTTSAPVSGTVQPANAALSAAVTPVSGVVTALSATSLSIRTTSGVPQTYSVSASTVVMQGRAKTTLASVHVGNRVFVVPSSTSPTTAVAIGIVATPLGEGSDGGSEGSDGN